MSPLPIPIWYTILEHRAQSLERSDLVKIRGHWLFIILVERFHRRIAPRPIGSIRQANSIPVKDPVRPEITIVNIIMMVMQEEAGDWQSIVEQHFLCIEPCR